MNKAFSMQQDILGRHNYTQIQQAAKEAGFTDRQLDWGLDKLGYKDDFPENGIDDEGERRLFSVVGELDATQAALRPVKSLDLKVLEPTVEIQNKSETRELAKQLVNRTRESLFTTIAFPTSIRKGYPQAHPFLKLGRAHV